VNLLKYIADDDVMPVSVEAVDLADLMMAIDDEGEGRSGLPSEKYGEEAVEEDNFEPSEDPEYIPRVKAGEIWKLGRHYIACGDCTVEANIRSLMAAAEVEKVDCIWTDPPYGVSYEGKTKDKLKIQNDSLSSENLEPFLIAAFGSCVVASGGSSIPCYVAHPAGELHNTFYQSIVKSGFKFKQTLVWVKNAFAMGRSDYHYRHEPIYYACTPGGIPPSRMGNGEWFGDHCQDSVFFFDKPNANRLHPTMKPIGLICAMLRNSAPEKGWVFDPFGGSGSTLIAAEELGLTALLTELDEVYASVICDRWEAFTGLKSEKVGALPNAN
jgi:DNA modification methylase